MVDQETPREGGAGYNLEEEKGQVQDPAQRPLEARVKDLIQENSLKSALCNGSNNLTPDSIYEIVVEEFTRVVGAGSQTRQVLALFEDDIKNMDSDDQVNVILTQILKKLYKVVTLQDQGMKQARDRVSEDENDMQQELEYIIE